MYISIYIYIYIHIHLYVLIFSISTTLLAGGWPGGRTRAPSGASRTCAEQMFIYIHHIHYKHYTYIYIYIYMHVYYNIFYNKLIQ